MAKTVTRRLLWGLPANAPSSENTRTIRRVMLLAYWICSTIYRWTLYTAILWMVYLAAESKEVGGLVGVMLLAIVAMVAYRGVHNVLPVVGNLDLVANRLVEVDQRLGRRQPKVAFHVPNKEDDFHHRTTGSGTLE